VEEFFGDCGEIESVELVSSQSLPPHPSSLNPQPSTLNPQPSSVGLSVPNTKPGQKSDERFADLPRTKAFLNPKP
jgi:hypothetical protein